MLIGSSAPAFARQHKSAPTAPRTITIPGTDREFEFGSIRGGAEQAFLRAISGWIAANSEFTGIDDIPKIERTTPTEMARVRWKLGSGKQDARSVTFAHDDSLIAIYVDDTRTIYLRVDWSGRTLAELSVLVHELVHHYQNVAGVKYNCPQEREKLAYRMQERWLNLYRRSLASEFNIDPFSLLVKTSCLY